jgi:hypothetical protein
VPGGKALHKILLKSGRGQEECMHGWTVWITLPGWKEAIITRAYFVLRLDVLARIVESVKTREI